MTNPTRAESKPSNDKSDTCRIKTIIKMLDHVEQDKQLIYEMVQRWLYLVQSSAANASKLDQILEKKKIRVVLCSEQPQAPFFRPKISFCAFFNVFFIIFCYFLSNLMKFYENLIKVRTSNSQNNSPGLGIELRTFANCFIDSESMLLEFYFFIFLHFWGYYALGPIFLKSGGQTFFGKIYFHQNPTFLKF